MQCKIKVYICPNILDTIFSFIFPYMAEIRHQQGFRLKKFIEQKQVPITEIVEKLGISRATIYNWFEQDELLLKKIQPVLDIIGVSAAEFMALPLVEDPQAKYGLQALVDSLTRENEILKQQVQQLQDMVALLKSKNVVYIKPSKKTTKK